MSDPLDNLRVRIAGAISTLEECAAMITRLKQAAATFPSGDIAKKTRATFDYDSNADALLGFLVEPRTMSDIAKRFNISYEKVTYWLTTRPSDIPHKIKKDPSTMPYRYSLRTPPQNEH